MNHSNGARISLVPRMYEAPLILSPTTKNTELVTQEITEDTVFSQPIYLMPPRSVIIEITVNRWPFCSASNAIQMDCLGDLPGAYLDVEFGVYGTRGHGCIVPQYIIVCNDMAMMMIAIFA